MPRNNSCTLSVLAHKEVSLITELYNYYILNTTATYDWEPFTEREMAENLFRYEGPYLPYAIRCENNLCGFCKLSPFNPKKGYRITAEVTLYIQPEFIGRGCGPVALRYLEEIATQNGIKNLIPIISSENSKSIAFFRKQGYEEHGRLSRVGYKFGRFLDTLYYQKTVS